LEAAASERPELEETKSGMRLRSVSISTTDILHLYPLMGEGFPRGDESEK
jgi:hypothetical protein